MGRRIPSANPYVFRPQAGEADPYAAARPQLDPQIQRRDERNQNLDRIGRVATAAVLGIGTAGVGSALAGAGGGAAGIGGLPAGMGVGGSTIGGSVAAPVAAAGIGGLPAGMGVGGSVIGGQVAAPAAGVAARSFPWGRALTAGAGLTTSLMDRRNPNQDALQQTLGGPRPDVSTAMPVERPGPLGPTDGKNGGVINTPTLTTPPPTSTTGPTGTVAPVAGPPPAGWDPKNWADPNMHTVKYDAGRLLYGATRPSDVARIVASPEFQARFPGATFDGKDKVDFRGALSEGSTGSPVGIIDVLLSADQDADTSNGIWWGFEPDGGMASPSSPVTSLTKTPNPMGVLNPGQNNNFLAQILESLATQQETNQQDLLLQQLR